MLFLNFCIPRECPVHSAYALQRVPTIGHDASLQCLTIFFGDILDGYINEKGCHPDSLSFV